VVALACIPTSSVPSFSPTSSPTHVGGGVFDDGYSKRWNLSVVLICIPFMARDGEHFFT
jgi:hypothetical protein